MSDKPFASAAWVYRKAGWLGTLPVVGKSGNLPQGFTGREGRWPTDEEVLEWTISRPMDNIALRFPKAAMGMDLDGYDGKQGLATFNSAWEELGPLPKTWSSTSRTDGTSGIYLYRKPEELELASIFEHGGTSDIEVIQYSHRYAVAAPSLHPGTGLHYRWIRPDGTMTTAPPKLDDLPELPVAWQEYYRKDSGLIVPHDAVEVAPQEAERSEWHDDVAVLVHKIRECAQGPAGSRHDNARDLVMALARAERRGLEGATTALSEVEDTWTELMREDRNGHARKEMQDLISGARKLASTTPSHPLVTDGEWVEIEVEELDPFAPLVYDDEEDEPGLEDLTLYWEGEVEPVLTDFFSRSDQVKLLYLFALNLIFGDSGSAKTWLMLCAALQAIREGRTIIWVHYEDPTPKILVDRLKLMGIQPHEFERFRYYNPKGRPLEAERLVRACRQVGADHVILDSLGEALAASSMNEDNDADVGPYFARVLRPVVNAGYGLTAIDHVTKENKNPLHPSGSKRKRAAVTGAALRVEAIKPPTQTEDGLVKVVCAKDRNGTLQQGADVALVEFRHEENAAGDGDDLRITVKPPTAADEFDMVKAAVIKHVTENDALTKTSIVNEVQLGSRGMRKKAVDEAANEGKLEAYRATGAVRYRIGNQSPFE